MVDPEIKQRCERFWDEYADSGVDYLMQPLGATEKQVQSVIRLAGCPLPEDYLNFLRFADGFCDIFSVADVLESTAWFQQFETGGIVIGNDGGEGIFVLDLRGASEMPYAYLPTESHQWGEVSTRWPDFKALFLAISPNMTP